MSNFFGEMEKEWRQVAIKLQFIRDLPFICYEFAWRNFMTIIDQEKKMRNKIKLTGCRDWDS